MGALIVRRSPTRIVTSLEPAALAGGAWSSAAQRASAANRDKILRIRMIVFLPFPKFPFIVSCIGSAVVRSICVFYESKRGAELKRRHVFFSTALTITHFAPIVNQKRDLPGAAFFLWMMENPDYPANGGHSGLPSESRKYSVRPAGGFRSNTAFPSFTVP